MLKRDPKGRFEQVGFFFKSYRFCSDKIVSNYTWSATKYSELMESQQNMPVLIQFDFGKNMNWWMFNEDFYMENEDLKDHEVKALAMDIARRKNKQIKNAIALMDQDESIDRGQKRKSIPDDVKMYVWQRDEGKCVQCGSNNNLEYDHIIPVAKGGGNTSRNLQILCESCNRSKGGRLI